MRARERSHRATGSLDGDVIDLTGAALERSPRQGRAGLAAWVPSRRALHLVDVDNLLGCPPSQAVPGDVVAALGRYTSRAKPGADDHVVLACNPRLAFAVRSASSVGQLLVRRGRGGADRALLDHADVDHIQGRYQRVVIGSGNGAFASLVRALRGRSVQTTVIALTGHLSWDLRRAASVVVVLQHQGSCHPRGHRRAAPTGPTVADRAPSGTATSGP